MAKKAKTVFVCQECGHEEPRWQGKCICGAWNSFVEEKLPSSSEEDSRRRAVPMGRGKNYTPVALSTVKSEGDKDRIDTEIGELNRVLGGGIVPGSLTLISGEPGVGKSTLILQMANNIAKQGMKVLYVSGEESQEQIKIRADRICGRTDDRLLVLSETNIESIWDAADAEKVDFLIVDSIQTLYTQELDSAPGSVSQVRACGNELMRYGKTKNVPIFMVAHVTKSGDLAGPKIVEHLVDCVIHFGGDRHQELRILRAFKNRFGTTSEIGAFEMAEEGLVEVSNLSERFLAMADYDKEGSITGAVYEGTRPLLMEIQALTARSNLNFPRRTCIGVDVNRLNMLIAVLERHCGVSLYDQDVFVNVVGGIKPEGTSVDLAVAMAMYSSYNNCRAKKRLLAVGEIGLTGELRSTQHIDKIVKEAKRMGFEGAVVPKASLKRLNKLGQEDFEIIGARSLAEAIGATFRQSR